MPHDFVAVICKACGRKFTAPNGTGITTCGPCNTVFVNALREFLGLDKIDKRVMPRKEQKVG